MSEPPKENNRSSLWRPLLLNAGKYLDYVFILGGPRRIVKSNIDNDNPDNANPPPTARTEKAIISSRKRSLTTYSNTEGVGVSVQHNNPGVVDANGAGLSIPNQKKYALTESNKYEKELKRLSSSSARSSSSSDRTSGVVPQYKDLQFNQIDLSRSSSDIKLPKNLQEVVYV